MRSTRRKLVLYPAVAMLAPILAACESAVTPDLPALREETACSSADAYCGGERLVFAGTEELQAYLEPLQEASKEELEEAEARNGFQSLRAYLDGNEDTEETAKAGDGSEDPTGNEARALEVDGVTREDFPVGDAFLSVLNSRGEVEIEGRVYKVTRDYVYEVAAEDVAVLDEQVPTLGSDVPADDPRITVHKVETTLAEDPGEPAGSQAGGALFNHVPGVGGHCYVYGASDRRMHGKSYISNFFFYAEAGVTTEWERRKKFLWWTYWSNTWQSGTLSHEYNGDLYVGTWAGPWSPVGPGTGFQSQTGTSKIHKTLAWAVGFGMRIRGSIHTRHNVANGYVTSSCDTDAGA